MLKVENLNVKIGQAQILQDISLHIKAGEIVGVIGQNGSGKTTLLNALSGYVTSQSGEIIYSGDNITDLPPEKRARMGMTRSFQTPGVFREMTVKENLLMALERAHHYPWWWEFSRKWRSKAANQIEHLLKSMNLENHMNSYAGLLSGGQLRLLELLRLEICGGKLFLIDEPTAGVAPAMKQTLIKKLKELTKKDGRSLLLVEHDLKLLFELVDRVIVLVEGKIYLEGSVGDIAKDPRLQEVYFGTNK